MHNKDRVHDIVRREVAEYHKSVTTRMGFPLPRFCASRGGSFPGVSCVQQLSWSPTRSEEVENNDLWAVWRLDVLVRMLVRTLFLTTPQLHIDFDTTRGSEKSNDLRSKLRVAVWGDRTGSSSVCPSLYPVYRLSHNPACVSWCAVNCSVHRSCGTQQRRETCGTQRRET